MSDTKSFFTRLEERARAVNSLLCVGLDPRADAADELRAECRRLIEATASYALAFKPNSAFFEAHGAEGMAALRDVIASIPKDIPVILDAKRGDIGETSEAYARAAFEILGAHALTVNPYLGSESLGAFMARSDRGVFILCKTSNPGADEFQSLTVDGSKQLYEVVAEHAQKWNTKNNVGLVVGATYPQAIARARELAPDLWFLVPGVGAQGGDLKQTLEAGLREDGLGLIINASRSIARAANPGEEAKRLRDEINAASRPTRFYEVPRSALEQKPVFLEKTGFSGNLLANDLLESGCVRFGKFTLKSGKVSPIYLDLRRLVSHPRILQRAAKEYAVMLKGLQFDRIAGLPYAALPIGTAISLEINRPLIYPRREVKEYGTKAAIEGDYNAGETIVVIDDLATTGDTKIESIQKLEAAGLKVKDIVVLIDREQGAKEMLAKAGYNFHAVTTLRVLLNEWRASGAITLEQFDEVMGFLGQTSVNT
ncbi:MAG: orotidine-5'-phosphate decarboxylase [Chloroflexi bacterium]|nr:orotidine-5'-phosphate decarboxylase [Chloroflexota bacterium]